ncbi:hypothetical protein AW736_26665 [Termitidicoccus mucosus]|uniref:CobW C-terminal domain-containing protein n=2 Tax=Termitidicoccus mucosus TaxID=1184151 RepID=A0A178IL21_9BACT|nr:hypothetical protein AW736_08240 [Opitutaceae bacterium TSB47]OAM91845.1 hypothetical protein AW736_26665 [Opitutaceae bacterium TSB47]
MRLFDPSLLGQLASGSKFRPDVTVISGFLGAGKTTLLQQLLKKTPHGLRVAIVVNDLNEINIDALFLEKMLPSESSASIASTVALGNGCVCCTARDALGDAIVELATSGKFDHIIIESSGAAEPRPVTDLFYQTNIVGPRLDEVATLHVLITVVDAAAWFQASLEEHRLNADALGKVVGAHQSLFTLMVEQVECADVIFLNKIDLVTSAESETVSAQIRGLNLRAELIKTKNACLPDGVWPGACRFDPIQTRRGANWMDALNQARKIACSSPELRIRSQTHCVRTPAGKLFPVPGRSDFAARYGLGSFLYTGRKPCAAARLRKFFEQGWPGLVRAKGFFWSVEEPNRIGFLSVAGRETRIDYLGPWAAALVERGSVPFSAIPDSLREFWQEPSGDRRQEIVLIGVNLDADALGRALNEQVISFTHS